MRYRVRHGCSGREDECLRLRPLTSQESTSRRRSPGALSFSKAMLSSRRLRESVLLTLGVITPVGILAVNASAFDMAHLTQFRIGFAACTWLTCPLIYGQA